MSDEDRDRELLAEGKLISHLVELRQRLLKVVIAIAICFAPCAWFANELFTIVATPLIKKMPVGTSMIATSLISPFMAPLKRRYSSRCSSRCRSMSRCGRSSHRACTSARSASPSR